jgi:ParB/RepB/Spo0J family partition protein
MTSGQFKSVALDFIWVERETRQRRELKNIEELAHSISTVGLINPPVIKRDGELIAGERRWTAVKSLGWTSIPVQFVDELDPAELHLLELEENVQRMQLPWEEECKAVEEYHRLQRERDPDWSMEKTGEMLGIKKTSVSEKIAVARELLSGNTMVAGADKFSTARGIVQRAQERKAAAATTLAIASVPGVKPAPAEAAPSAPIAPLLHADFHEWAAAYTDQPFNFLHCDFPYGVDADKHAQGQAKSQGGYADGFEVYVALLDTLETSMSNVVHDSAHLMFWFSMDYYQYTLDRLTLMGWRVNPFPLMWMKDDNTGILPDPSRGPRRIYETAFMAARGDRKIVRAKSNAFAHPGKDKSIHMSEKPVPMLKHFMEMFVDEYSFCLDPTAGSANSLKAAQGLGAGRVLGLERDEEFFSRAKEAYFNE